MNAATLIVDPSSVGEAPMKHVGTTVLMILVAVGLSHAAAGKEICNVLPEPSERMLDMEIEEFGAEDSSRSKKRAVAVWGLGFW